MKYITFSTEEGAQSRAAHLHNEYFRSTGAHAYFTPQQVEDKWYVPVLQGFEKFYSEIELQYAVEMPEQAM